MLNKILLQRVLSDAGYVPSNTEKYPLGGIIAAIQTAFHINPEVMCVERSVQEIRLCFHKDFKVFLYFISLQHSLFILNWLHQAVPWKPWINNDLLSCLFGVIVKLCNSNILLFQPRDCGADALYGVNSPSNSCPKTVSLPLREPPSKFQ